MSTVPTQITDEINDYLISNFSRDDDLIKDLLKKSEQMDFPQIHISPLQAAYLQFLIKVINAKYVMEFGSLAGYSAISMARALPDDGKLIALEINPEYASFITDRTKEAGLENIIQVENSPALDFLETYNPDHKLDLVFIDADKENYLNYAKKVAPHIRKGGLMIADNALGFGYIADEFPEEADEVIPIREFNKWFFDNPEFFASFVTIGDGMLMGVKL
jgi:predicted O-methyltransferase YrrM